MQKAQVVWTTWACINGGEGGRLWLKKSFLKNQPLIKMAESFSVPPRCPDGNACLAAEMRSNASPLLVRKVLHVQHLPMLSPAGQVLIQ